MGQMNEAAAAADSPLVLSLRAAVRKTHPGEKNPPDSKDCSKYAARSWAGARSL